MPNDPWSDVAQTFAAARAGIRKAQDETVAEYRRQTELDSVARPARSNPAFDRIMAGRVGGAA
jgi:hypothetical protein